MASYEVPKDINLLVMGKTGHGKSSTGNSILGRREFVALGGGPAVTKAYQSGYTRVDGRVIKVVDIPGVCDPDRTLDEDGKLELVIKAIDEGLKQFPEGFNALLLVLSYTARMTLEEYEAIQALKMILGENILSDHTVLVFTHGDSFYKDVEDHDVDFKSWCRRQKQYNDLLEECRGRFVLFNNLTRIKEEKQSQVRELIFLVDHLKHTNTNFTLDKFKKAGKERDELKRVSSMLEFYSREIGLIKNDLYQVMLSTSETRLEVLTEMKATISRLINNIQREDHEKLLGTKLELDSISMRLNALEGMVIRQEQDKKEREELLSSLNKMKEQADREREQARIRDDRMKEEMEKLQRQISTQIDKAEQKINQERSSGFWDTLIGVGKTILKMVFPFFGKFL